VLAQQSGPLSQLTAQPATPPNGGPNNSPRPDKRTPTTIQASRPDPPSSEQLHRPASEATTIASAEPPTTETSSAATQQLTGRRRP
jgi:hypothetical protein